MPQKVANSTVKIGREGKSFLVAAGSTFDFTADEIKEINSHGEILRDPKNESPKATTISTVSPIAPGGVPAKMTPPPKPSDDGGL